MFQDRVSESIMPPPTASDQDLRDAVSVSIYPITGEQWLALKEVATDRGETRSDLFREAIGHLLDERDAGIPVTYTAAPRLHPIEKIDTKPRIVWLKSPLSERFRDRCEEDRVSQSEFILEAVRRYLRWQDIETTPSI